MIQALLDINVFLDVMQLRQGHEEAAIVLSLAKERAFHAYISAHEATTLAYLLEKNGRTRNDIRKTLTLVFELVETLPVDQPILEASLHSRIDDFEDAVLEAVARKKGADCIITRNIRDFTHSKIRAMTPTVFLQWMEEKKRGFSVRESTPAYRTRKRRRSANIR